MKNLACQPNKRTISILDAAATKKVYTLDYKMCIKFIIKPPSRIICQKNTKVIVNIILHGEEKCITSHNDI